MNEAARENESTSAPHAVPWLENSLLFTTIIHAVAMLSMALLLMPGMQGGWSGEQARIAYVAEHPWLWRLGWLPWQLTALSDLLVAIALLKTPWVPRLPAIITLLITICAVSIEQPGELKWITEGVRMAQEALISGDPTRYINMESELMQQVGAVAALAYTLAALGWTWCLAAAGIWNRFLTVLSAVTWSIMFAVTAGPLLPQPYRLPSELAAAGNALGFVLLLVWFVVVLELVLKRSRPETRHGGMAPWHHPDRTPLGSLINLLGNSRVLRLAGEKLPFVPLTSDIDNVIYLNYLVPSERLERFVPWGLELQKLGPDGEYALFSILTFRHGHFAPRFFGPLRKLMPSPIQSNWRVHVRDPETDAMGIYFIATIITNTFNALLARTLSDGVSMHVPKSGTFKATDGGRFHIDIVRGDSSSPDLKAAVEPCHRDTELPEPWKECFDTFPAFLAYCVPQDRAMYSQPWYERIVRQEIFLGIPLDVCQRMQAEIASDAIREITGDASPPLVFRVPEVDFLFNKIEFDSRKKAAPNRTI